MAVSSLFVKKSRAVFWGRSWVHREQLLYDAGRVSGQKILNKSSDILQMYHKNDTSKFAESSSCLSDIPYVGVVMLLLSVTY